MHGYSGEGNLAATVFGSVRTALVSTKDVGFAAQVIYRRQAHMECFPVLPEQVFLVLFLFLYMLRLIELLSLV